MASTLLRENKQRLAGVQQTRSKACLHRRRQPAEKPPRQSRVIDQNNPLSFGNHVGYIANHSAVDNEWAGKE
jgi:hypothetical protein